MLAMLDGDGQRLVFDVVDVLLDGAAKQPISLKACMDAVLDVEAGVLAAVVDQAHALPRQALEAKLLGDLGVQSDLSSAERDALHVELVANDRGDILWERLAGQRYRSQRLADPYTHRVSGGQACFDRLPRPPHVRLDLRVKPLQRLPAVTQVDRISAREVARHLV